MMNKLAIGVLNQLLLQNPGIMTQLKNNLSMQIICLNLPLLSLNFQINPKGRLEYDSNTPDCQITVPLATAAHLIHKNQMKTFSQLEISGNLNVARTFLSLIAGIQYLNLRNLLYQHNLPLLGIATLKLEKLIQGLIDYARLVSSNLGLSSSHYLQYEANFICDHFTLDQFYDQVDELNERSQLLAKRIERLNHLS